MGTELERNDDERLGNQITKDYADKKPLVVGLLKGCMPFMTELIKNIPPQVIIQKYSKTDTQIIVDLLKEEEDIKVEMENGVLTISLKKENPITEITL